VPTKDDYCICCFAFLPPPCKGQRFCARCQEHRGWCVSMSSKTVKWDAITQQWRVIRVVEAESQGEPVGASWLE
jgi:hypothetical protein